MDDSDMLRQAKDVWVLSVGLRPINEIDKKHTFAQDLLGSFRIHYQMRNISRIQRYGVFTM